MSVSPQGISPSFSESPFHFVRFLETELWAANMVMNGTVGGWPTGAAVWISAVCVTAEFTIT